MVGGWQLVREGAGQAGPEANFACVEESGSEGRVADGGARERCA